MKPSQIVFLVLMALGAGWLLWAGKGGSSKAEASDLVHWMEPAEAQAENQKTHKPFLYDFTAAWCGPCRAMQQEVFRDPAGAEFINQSFVPVRVMDRRREDGRNLEWVDQLESRFGLEAFPTLAVDRGGQTVSYRGYRGRQQTLDFLKQSLGDSPVSY